MLEGAIHSTKIPTGPTGKSFEKTGPPFEVDPFFRNFSGWTEPIHWVLDRNFRKLWLNGSRPETYRRLHLPLNARAQNMFSRYVTWRKTSEFQVSNFEIFPPKCEVPGVGFCTLCFCFPTKMLHLNAPFFPLKCSVAPKKSLKCLDNAHYTNVFLN